MEPFHPDGVAALEELINGEYPTLSEETSACLVTEKIVTIHTRMYVRVIELTVNVS